jgi:transcriptional regulator with PAS, ATPase and Fis domain
MDTPLDFQQIVEKCGYGIMTTDSSGLITHVNRAAQLILGEEAAALIGSPPPETLFAMAKAAMESRRSQKGIASIANGSKGGQILLTVTPFGENSQMDGCILGLVEPMSITRDETATIRLREELRQARALVETLRAQLAQSKALVINGQSWSPDDQGLVATLEGIEKQILEQAAVTCQTTRQMATHLKISQPSIVRRLKKYGITLN